jgi:hypothetical protein
MAYVDRPFGRRIAHIRVREGFLDEEPEVIRHVIVHELLHVVCSETEALMLTTVANISDVGLAFSEAYRTLHEFDIDHFAILLAQHVPLFTVRRPPPG